MESTKSKRICIVSNDYPCKNHAYYTFVQQLAYGLSAEGNAVSIIAPLSLTHAMVHHDKLLPTQSEDISPEGRKIRVYRPRILSFGSSSASNSLFTKIQYHLIKKAISKYVNKIDDLDILYCYFWHMGLSAAACIADKNIKIITQASEGEITVPPFLKTEKNLKRVDGVVCASKKNMEESQQAGLLSTQKYQIISNGFRSDEFHQMDRSKAREHLGFPQDKFIIIFVGSFIERKGIKQLCVALNRFDDVHSIFIGKGPLNPDCKNMLFSGSVTHNELIWYLNCADAFVLPTRAEGCCNAIVEAIGCGLPIISSKRNFNDEILNNECSIRIDDQSVDEIEEAIRRIKDSPELAKKMSNASILKSHELTISHRTEAILRFVEDV